MAYGAFNTESNNYAIQKGTGFSTIDASTVPKQSPETVGAAEVEIKAPAKAAQLVITNTTTDIWVDNATGVGNAQGAMLKADGSITLDVSPDDITYLIRDAADSTVSFLFNLINK